MARAAEPPKATPPLTEIPSARPGAAVQRHGVHVDITSNVDRLGTRQVGFHGGIDHADRRGRLPRYE